MSIDAYEQYKLPLVAIKRKQLDELWNVAPMGTPTEVELKCILAARLPIAPLCLFDNWPFLLFCDVFGAIIVDNIYDLVLHIVDAGGHLCREVDNWVEQYTATARNTVTIEVYCNNRAADKTMAQNAEAHNTDNHILPWFDPGLLMMTLERLSVLCLN